MKRKHAKNRQLSLQPLESRRVLAASLGWDGPGLGTAELTYNIANYPSSLTQAQTNAAIETALSAWSNVAGIKFTPTNQGGLRDSLDISFTNIDGPGRTLAQAYFPDDVNPARIAGDVQFDLSEAWEVGNSLGNRAFDLVWVAVHEIGHSLGLDHSNAVSSVLAAFVSPNQSFLGLNASDVSAIRGLYAATGGSVVTPSSTTTTTVDPPVVVTPTTTTTDTDDDPFPRHRWHRGGNWHRFGGRLEIDTPDGFNLYNPTDVNGDSVTTASDALTIINQLNRMASGDDSEVVGMCDTNGDGEITASDALVVINAMNTSSVVSGQDNAVASLDDSDVTTVNDAGNTDDTVTETDDVPVDDDAPVNTVDPLDDTDTTTETPTDETDTTDSDVDPTDTGDDTDSTTDVDDTEDTTDTDDVDDTDETIDDGGLTDEDDDCHGGSRDHDGRHGGHHAGDFGHGLFAKSGEALLARFDADASGSLSEAEVPTRVWEFFASLSADADIDGFVTLQELDVAVAAARQEKIAEKFAEKDTDANGLLTEDEVSTRFWARHADAETDGEAGISLAELEAFLVSKQTERVPTATPITPAIRIAHVDHAFSQLGRARFGRSSRGFF